MGLVGARLPVGGTRFAATLFEERRLVWSDDAPLPHQSCVLIPLVAKANVSGVLHLIWWTQARRLGATEVALLQAIGQQAGATSLANAAAHEINNPLDRLPTMIAS